MTSAHRKFAKHIPALRDHFVPIVERVVDRAEFFYDAPAIDVVFVEEMKVVNGLMYHVRLRPVDGTPAADLALLLQGLDVFCSREEDEGPTIDGYKFRIGDGDDSLAVFFDGGYICIWLRGWKE